MSASKSLKLLCHIVTKPPFLQLRVCVTLYFSLQGQIAGKPLRGLPYLKLRASLNSLLFRVKANSSKGNHGSRPPPPPLPPIEGGDLKISDQNDWEEPQQKIKFGGGGS